MVRLCARRTGRALDHIQPIHIAGIGIAPLGKIAGVAGEARKSRVEKVGVERENYVRVFQLVLSFHRLPECHPGALEHVVAVDGLIYVPLGLRIFLEYGTQLVGERRRGDGRG